MRSFATQIENVDASNPAVQHEIFGPALTVQTFDEANLRLKSVLIDFGVAASAATTIGE